MLIKKPNCIKFPARFYFKRVVLLAFLVALLFFLALQHGSNDYREFLHFNKLDLSQSKSDDDSFLQPTQTSTSKALKDRIKAVSNNSDSQDPKSELVPLQLISSKIKLTKRILFQTVDNENDHLYVVGVKEDSFKKAGCPVWQCQIFHKDMNLTLPIEDYDAVVFFDPVWNEESKPTKRSPRQRYVFWNLEAPGWHRPYERWNTQTDFFNWTMTYRSDSDIVHSYGWFTRIPHKELPSSFGKSRLEQVMKEVGFSDGKHYAKGKTKLVAWFVSNCNISSGRNEYVERLQKFIPVDVYGKCGNTSKSCSRSNERACSEALEKEYKFYLSFENSLCAEYVTEKLFSKIKLNVVPIVIDLHGNQAKLAPPHSFINALDFPTVNALADYLLLLDRNDTLYNEYFWWKKYYESHDHTGKNFYRGFCDLCARLHDTQQEPKVYHNLTEWWAKKSECKVLRFNDLKENSNNETTYMWSSERLL